LVIGSIGSGKSHLLKNITTDKKYRFGRYGQYQKIISANSTFLFKEKKPFWRCSGRISPPRNQQKNQRENVIHLCDTIMHRFRRSNIVWLSMIFQSRQRPKKFERLKDICDRRRCQGSKSGEHFFYLELRNSKLKIYQGAKRWLINQLANNLEVQDRNVFHIFDQTVGNPRISRN
jgi:hypothetical protein